MRRMVWIYVLFIGYVFSCGPSQDNSATTDAKRIDRAETLFVLAYEALDAALMERLLSDDFRAAYPEQGAAKNRREWLSEIQSFRAIFPEMDVTVDSVRTDSAGGEYTVSAVRIFTWTDQDQRGTHREYYRNYWREEDGQWKLYLSEITPAP